MDFKAQYAIDINPIGLNGRAAETYKSKVNEHLTWIYLTKVGRMLLDSIRYHHLRVEIRPYTGNDCNSGGGWETPAGGIIRGYVNYSPDTFSIHGACPAHSSPNSGLYWDEILFHELVHVFRGVSKKWNQVKLGVGLTGYGDTEEFLAVMVTNIYISDRSNKIKSSLRRDHNDFSPLEPEFIKPFGFFATSTITFGLVRDFVSDNHGFSVMVAHADAPFNPIADFMVDKDKAQEISNKAAPRDLAFVTKTMLDLAKSVLR